MNILGLATIDLGGSVPFPGYGVIMLILGLVGSFTSLLTKHGPIYNVLGFFFTRRYKEAKHQHKYAVLIPARNEENVVGNLIESIKQQDYPQDLITIFVVAHNCSDNTASVAREYGAVCYEGNRPDERTKGYALKYLFEQIDRDYGIQSFEGYFIFDADNLLRHDYITRMNESFDAGDKIITSYRATKNLNESWIASTYALHWLRSIRRNHRPRSFLHLATNIQGTGFLFDSEIVKDGWKYTSLTEDRALTADCVVDGYEIAYNNEAIFYDEQPVSLRVACRQRLRWSKGHLQAFAESGWGLFRNIFIDRHTKREDYSSFSQFLWATIRHRWMSYDTFAQLVPRSVINLAKWIAERLIVYPVVCYKLGLEVISALYQNTILAEVIENFFGGFVQNLQATHIDGLKAYVLCALLMIYLRLSYRVGRYFVNALYPIYLYIVEYRRMNSIPFWKRVLYCLTWPTFDIIGRYTQYIALFKKVDWKPIPHNSKVKIGDIKDNRD